MDADPFIIVTGIVALVIGATALLTTLAAWWAAYCQQRSRRR